MKIEYLCTALPSVLFERQQYRLQAAKICQQCRKRPECLQAGQSGAVSQTWGGVWFDHQGRQWPSPMFDQFENPPWKGQVDEDRTEALLNAYVQKEAMMKTTDIDAKCPRCGYVVEATSDLMGDAVPKDGDISVCIECSQIGVFTDNATGLRMPTPEEEAEVENDPELVKIRMGIMVVNERNRK